MAYFEKRGDSWRAQIRRKGYRTLSKAFKRKVDAQAWARDIESQIDGKAYHEPNTDAVRTLFDKYLLEVAPKNGGSRADEIRIKRLLADATMMDIPLGEIGPKHIIAWRDARCKQVSNATVNREMNMISAVFSHAMNEWHIELDANPVRTVKRPEKPKHRTRRVLDTELAAIWKHFGTEVGTKRSYTPWLFELAMETALRKGELCQIRWEDVHEDERWLFVAASKNGDSRSVPLSARALELLKGLPHDTERVFPIELGSVDTEFRRAMKTLGIVGLHFHDTRHEACTRLSKTFSVLDLAKIVGHRDLKSLMVYYNPTAKELAAQFDQPRSMP